MLARSVLLVGTRPDRIEKLHESLDAAGYFVIEAHAGPAAPHLALFADCAVVELESGSHRAIRALKDLLETVPTMPRLVVVDDASWGKAVQANALGAQTVVARPVTAAKLADAIGLLLSRNGGAQVAPVARALHAGQAILSAVFSLRGDMKLAARQSDIAKACDSMLANYRATRLPDWIRAVDSHHSQTYRHCLLVTGLAAAFGHHLRLGEPDLRRLALGGLLHDLGKARVPVAILEKPARLTREEEAVMRDHPGIGRDLMLASGEFDAEMIDVVAHHHERLDGSGYPDGLAGGSISDLARVIGIVDIFAAMIERRAYRRPHSPESAFAQLMAMEGKVDLPLVRAFEPIALGARWSRAA